MTDKLQLKLIVNVKYALNGTNPAYLKKMLTASIDRAFDEGLLTGSTDAEIQLYACTVKEIKP